MTIGWWVLGYILWVLVGIPLAFILVPRKWLDEYQSGAKSWLITGVLFPPLALYMLAIYAFLGVMAWLWRIVPSLLVSYGEQARKIVYERSEKQPDEGQELLIACEEPGTDLLRAVNQKSV